MSRFPIFATLLPLSLLGSGSPQPPTSGDRGPGRSVTSVDRTATLGHDDVLGTIEATIDGEEVTFYIVSGSLRGEPYASAAWYIPREENGEVLAAIGGFDTPNPPFDTFEQGADGSPASFGDYDGPVLSLVLYLGNEPAPFKRELPSQDDGTGLVYMSRAEFGDMSVMYMAASGVVDVTEVELKGRRLRAVGTFSGTFRNMADGSSVEVENGRFEVRDVPPLDEVSGKAGSG